MAFRSADVNETPDLTGQFHRVAHSVGRKLEERNAIES